VGVSAAPLLELFRADVAACGGRIEQHLGELAGGRAGAQRLDAVARDAQVIASAAWILGIEPAVRLARALARAAAAGARGQVAPGEDLVEAMFGATTVLARVAAASAHIDGWMAKYGTIVDEAEAALATTAGPPAAAGTASTHGSGAAPTPGPPVDDRAPVMALLRVEIESHGAVLADGLLALDNDPAAAATLDALMRAAHSIKSAGHAAHHDAVVRIAHELEACVVAAQDGRVTLGGDAVDAMLRGADRLRELAALPEAALPAWLEANTGALDDELAALAALHTPRAATAALARRPGAAVAAPAAPAVAGDRVVRVGADHLDRIMALAGETVVDASWPDPFAGSLATLKRRQLDLAELLDQARTLVVDGASRDRLAEVLHEARGKMRDCQQSLTDRMTDLATFSHQSASLSARLYNEVIGSRMRPFSDGLTELPRLVRDLARQLGKQVQLDIAGGATQVDREVLDKLAAPLAHLVRNALDHGIERPEERAAAGKPASGTLRIEARHRAGRLAIVVADDGRGVDFAAVRDRIAVRGLAPADQVAQMPDSELTGFLFQPGFSMATALTDLSGRGVGLDIVQDVVRQLGGKLRAEPQAGRGMTFHLELPITRSVLRTLLVEIGGEAFAFPLVRVDRVLQVGATEVASLEGRQYFELDGENVGLVAAHQVLELPGGGPRDELCVVLVSDHRGRYGLSVDRFLGERDLVVQPLDPRLAKVPDVAAASIMHDGTPVVILDVDDLVRSVDGLLAGNRLRPVLRPPGAAPRKRVLVVDDSTTVRETLAAGADRCLDKASCQDGELVAAVAELIGAPDR
jgi:two-component system sensor histidine kinase and response regulator WspE